ncbi:hypothetical protein [Curtobacterium sp. MCSS17_007]|uniref:hypothetical protein n=1 Tax=Curtobacterium sp. MCSS17_007 TaxID=2175646 RepID=UPI000DA82332|nr:hypothetical protein [Curtobacterium sp. MCSS17_007]WIE76569.1 hypothetical protein DEJ22_004705 [Curtobacterium sp. MCSS17_007]
MTVTLSRPHPVPTGAVPAPATLRPLPPVAVRWLLRAAFALPYVVLAVIASRIAPTPLLELTGNQVTMDRATAALDGGVVQAIGQLWPLLSGVLLRFMPFGVDGAAVLGGVTAGVLLQLLAQAMLRRGLPMRKVVAFTIALGANPLYAFVALNDLQAFLGIALFALAVVDMVRFFAWGDTQAGFRAGLSLMMSTLLDPMGFVYVVIAALAAPLLDLARRGQQGVRRANVLVLVFPSAAVALSTAVLDVMVLHDPFAALRGSIDVSGERLAGLQHLFATADGLLLVAMLVAGAALALLVGRPGAIALVAALFGGIIGGYAIGLIPVAAAGNVFVTMLSVAIAILPRAGSRVTSALVVLLAVLQVPLAWAAAFQREVVVQWMHALVAVVAG